MWAEASITLLKDSKEYSFHSREPYILNIDTTNERPAGILRNRAVVVGDAGVRYTGDLGAGALGHNNLWLLAVT